MSENPSEDPLRLPLGFIASWSAFALMAFLFVGGTAQLMHLAWGVWFSEIVLFVGLTSTGFRILQLDPRHAMGIFRFDASSSALGFAFGLINYFAWAIPLMALAHSLFPLSMVERFDSSHIFDRASSLEVGIVVLGVSIAAPLGEEFLFRGFLQRGLAAHWGEPRAIVLSAFLFSAFHLDPVGLAARFELGVLFGVLAWKSGSIWPAMAAHCANNVISSFLFFLVGDEKEGELTWWLPLLMFIIGNASLLALTAYAKRHLRVAQPMELVGREPQWAFKLFLPWAAAGLASLLLVVAIDFRGIELNLLEAKLQPSKAVKEREEVKDLRARVRQGEADIQDYESLVKSFQPSMNR